jgi:O-antigen/teichoic acid export membrane protein
MTSEAAGKRIARNASVLMVSQLTTWLLTLLLTIFLPRYLGAAQVGKFQFANSIWAVVAVLVTFGTDTLLTKEIARSRTRARGLWRSALILRAILFALGAAGVVLYLNFFNYPPATTRVVYILAFSTLFWEFIGACQAVLQGIERMEFISLANIAGKAVNTGLAILMLLLGQDVYVIALVTVLSAAVVLGLEVYFLRRLNVIGTQASVHASGGTKQEASAESHVYRGRPFSFDAAVRMLRAGLPYLLSSLFLVAYGQVDVMVISLLLDDRAVGFYGSATQLFGTFLFVPTVLITAVFPTLARMYTQAPDALPAMIRRSFNMMLVLSIPIGFGLLVIADSLVVLLFGPEFAKSGPVLAMLGLVLILTYQNMLIGQFLISTDRQALWTLVLAVATAATIPLDLWLVPLFQRTSGNGAVGGAISFLITEGAMTGLGLFFLPRGMLDRSNFWAALRALAAGLMMVAAIWWCRNLFILLPVVLGAIVYPCLILLLRVLPDEDITLLRNAVTSIMARMRGRRAPAGA